MFGNDRNEIRRTYYDAWHKAQQGQELSPLELMIAEVVQLHPEYHKMLEAGEATLDADFGVDQGEANPFLHMGMHIAIREQVSTDLPPGLATIHQQLSQRADHHQAEHQMMECLGEVMWHAQRSGTEPDVQQYLECLRRI